MEIIFLFPDHLCRISLVKKVAVLTEKRAWENLLYSYSHNSFWFHLGIKFYQKKENQGTHQTKQFSALLLVFKNNNLTIILFIIFILSLLQFKGVHESLDIFKVQSFSTRIDISARNTLLQKVDYCQRSLSPFVHGDKCYACLILWK